MLVTEFGVAMRFKLVLGPCIGAGPAPGNGMPIIGGGLPTDGDESTADRPV